MSETPDYILGISAFYHDSAAALIRDGAVVAAAHEERFSRVKHDASFPEQAIRYVLEEGAVSLGQLCGIAFYDKPFLKFERLLETYHAFAPRGLWSFLASMPVWIKEKIFMRSMLERALKPMLAQGESLPTLFFPEHHLSHAASAFYPSPFEESAILTIDGVGEWVTTALAIGRGNTIASLREIHFPHSLGLLYSAFTAYCGFKVNSGEYKLMGLAPYGNPLSEDCREMERKIREELVDIRDDGSFFLNMRYFNYATGFRMYDEKRWQELFGLAPRSPESPEIDQRYMDMALAIQRVTEDIVLRLARTARELTGCANLCMAGGVALNCVANGKILEERIFDSLWVQPASGDAGGALGAALALWHIGLEAPRQPVGEGDAMQGAYLGPEYGPESIARVCRRFHAPSDEYSDESELCRVVADLLAEGMIVGWFQGRMEYGPRALGNRSILGDARDPEMQKRLNLKIKYREGFRPFAPAVLEEYADQCFSLDAPSPYMLLVAPVREELRADLPENYHELPLWERLYIRRSSPPAITHVDFSARIQTISRRTNPRYWLLADTFRQRHGSPVIVNTSFNVRGEPIVRTPEDAYRCFMRTEMDYLVLGDRVLSKSEQPPFEEKGDWREQYVLD